MIVMSMVMMMMLRTGSPPGTIRMVTMIVKRTIDIDEKDEDFFSFILKSFAVPNANDLGGHGLNFGQKRADRRHLVK